jgi:hypothetical protein
MKLYMIGNHVFAAPEVPLPNLDPGRLKFSSNGKNATVVDCGDLHTDWTDTQADGNNNHTSYADLRMLFTHSERDRSSFLLPINGRSYNKDHRICPSGVPGFTNINEVGGEQFNTGTMPTEVKLSLDQSNPTANLTPAYSHSFECLIWQPCDITNRSRRSV